MARTAPARLPRPGAHRPATSLKGRLDRAVISLGFQGILMVEKLIRRYSIVPDLPFLPPTTFPWVAEVEAGWQAMREELDEVLSYREALPNFQDISVDQAELTNDDRWKTFFFFAYGFRSEENCARCPRTAALLDRIPGLTTAFFSILGPGKHLPEHRGPYKGVLRYHLALKVPDPPGACRIKVGGEEAAWQEGHSLLFDDTYPHEAWNDTDQDRVVLFADVVRPLPPPVSWLNQLVIKSIASSPFVKDGKSRHEAWEKGFEELWRRGRG